VQVGTSVWSIGKIIMITWTDHKPTIEYLKKQPIWHGKDLFYAVCFGFSLGIIVGLIISL
jgi:hypothetical protein